MMTFSLITQNHEYISPPTLLLHLPTTPSIPCPTTLSISRLTSMPHTLPTAFPHLLLACTPTLSPCPSSFFYSLAPTLQQQPNITILEPLPTAALHQPPLSQWRPRHPHCFSQPLQRHTWALLEDLDTHTTCPLLLWHHTRNHSCQAHNPSHPAQATFSPTPALTVALHWPLSPPPLATSPILRRYPPPSENNQPKNYQSTLTMCFIIRGRISHSSTNFYNAHPSQKLLIACPSSLNCALFPFSSRQSLVYLRWAVRGKRVIHSHLIPSIIT